MVTEEVGLGELKNAVMSAGGENLPLSLIVCYEGTRGWMAGAQDVCGFHSHSGFRRVESESIF